ncbi:peptidase S10 [Shewanella sp. 202IG2-18]|uniref:S10 family peptidase n=1 Tax=Parashewanella hymeniacidonis TaxID=2807618 RepID=UPI0019609E50|nr:peptidase S10 [Parashewanella hymeniacidonis]MBM7070458.1 peptidase S10 [Parashewanella hymeniacidonis]
MNNRTSIAIALSFGLALISSPISLAADKPAKPIAQPKVFKSTSSVRINGDKVSYKTIAGGTLLKNDKQEAVANMFSTTYLRTDVKKSAKRPVTFVFNGGPGSASIWLHLGIYGPKRVEVPAGAKDDGAAPYKLVKNEYSLLDVTDLVFIDPIGTGVSHVVGKGENKDFWGVKQDAKSIAQFIQQWLTKHNRWNSPKYLAGESYGTTRAAAVTQELQGGWTDVSLNGVMLISSILDFTHARYQPGNNQPYLGFLPTMAATAFYHGKVSAEDKALGLEAFIEQSRQFALNDYATALVKGNRLSADEKQRVLNELARFTGLKESYLNALNLRVNAFRYEKELLRDQHKTVGRLDSRFIGNDYDSGGERFDADPSGYGIDGAYTAAINHYLANDLNVKLERPFTVLSSDVFRKWDWKIGRSMSFVNVAPYLGKAQRENSQFKIFVANGYYDFATPFFATENTIADNGIDPSRVEMKYYQAGHMMYIEPSELKQLSEDLRSFYK